MSREDTNSNVAGSTQRAIGLNSITLLVLPIFLVFALAVTLCARELAAHIVAGDGDGTMLTRISSTSPKASAGYELIGSSGRSSGAQSTADGSNEQ